MSKKLQVLETDSIRANRTIEKILCPSGRIVYLYNQDGVYFMVFWIKKVISSFEELYRAWLDSMHADRSFDSDEEDDIDKFLLTL